MGISVVATRFFDLKLLDKKLSDSKGYLLYDKNNVKIYEGGYSDTVIEPSYVNTNRGAENYVSVRIEDGNKIPVSIVYLNFDAMPLIQTVNENFIIVPMITAVRTIDSIFVANRETRGVLRYLMDVSKETYMAFTNDAQKLIYMDSEKEEMIVTDANKNEMQHLAFPLENNYWVAHTGAAVSPDNNYVAFFTSNGNYENPDFGVYVYDIYKNSVKKVGNTIWAEQIVWKDNNTFVNVVVENDNGVKTEKKHEVFTVK